jgi:hypothetical protein
MVGALLVLVLRPGVPRQGDVWLMLAAYALGSAALTTAGRFGGGMRSAMTLRYTTFALYLPVALIYLTALAGGNRRWLRLLGACALLGGMGMAIKPSLEQAGWVRRHHLQGKAGLHYIAVVSADPLPGAKLKPNDPGLMAWAEGLDKAGFLHPGLARDARMNGAGAGVGNVESVRIDGSRLIVGGWAVLPARREPADAVVLAWRDGAENEYALALAEDFGARPDVAARLGEPGYADCGWVVSVDRGRLPAEAVGLAAYAVDGATGEAYRLGGVVPLPK